MVCALNGMVVSSRTGVAHCFIRVGEKCLLLGKSSVYWFEGFDKEQLPVEWGALWEDA